MDNQAKIAEQLKENGFVVVGEVVNAEELLSLCQEAGVNPSDAMIDTTGGLGLIRISVKEE